MALPMIDPTGAGALSAGRLAVLSEFCEVLRSEMQLGFAVAVADQSERAEVRHVELATAQLVVLWSQQVIPETIHHSGGLCKPDLVPGRERFDDPGTFYRLVRLDKFIEREC